MKGYPASFKFSISAPEIEAHGDRRNRQADAEFSSGPFRPACVDGASIKDPWIVRLWAPW